MMKPLKNIQFFARVDILLGTGLALPKVGGFFLQFLHHLLSDKELVIDTYHTVLMQLLGIMVVLWGVVRLKQTAIWQIVYDCAARFFILLYLFYYYSQGQDVLLFFIGVELLGLYQLKFFFKKTRDLNA